MSEPPGEREPAATPSEPPPLVVVWLAQARRGLAIGAGAGAAVGASAWLVARLLGHPVPGWAVAFSIGSAAGVGAAEAGPRGLRASLGLRALGGLLAPYLGAALAFPASALGAGRLPVTELQGMREELAALLLLVAPGVLGLMMALTLAITDALEGRLGPLARGLVATALVGVILGPTAHAALGPRGALLPAGLGLGYLAAAAALARLLPPDRAPE